MAKFARCIFRGVGFSALATRGKGLFLMQALFSSHTGVLTFCYPRSIIAPVKSRRWAMKIAKIAIVVLLLGILLVASVSCIVVVGPPAA